jgi:hypothetical protein
MWPEKPNSDVLAEAELEKDGPFYVYLVYWRKCPVGTVKRLNRIPKYHKLATEEEKAEIRRLFKPNVGKWYNYWRSPTGPFFDSKEDAARQVILRLIADPASQDFPMFRAAIIGDTAEVERLMKEIHDRVTVEDGPPISHRRGRE